MQQIIRELVEKAGLTEEQALKSIHVMKEFIQSKVPPGFSQMIDNFFASTSNQTEPDPLDPAGAGAGSSAGATAHQSVKGEPLEDKVGLENMTEEAVEKMKEFAKQANQSLNEWMKDAEAKGEDMMEKIKGMFNKKEDKDAN